MKHIIIAISILFLTIACANNVDFNKKEYHESVQKIVRITNSDSTGIKYSIPVWSPDGKNIAYSDFNGDFYYSDFNGVLIKKLKGTEIYNGSGDLNWSRDGRYIAYLSHRALSSVRVIDLKNFTVKEVARNKWLSDPFWLFTNEGQKVSTISDMGIQYFSDNFESTLSFPEKILNRNVVFLSASEDTYIDENGEINDSINLDRINSKLSFDKKCISFILDGKLIINNLDNKKIDTIASLYENTHCLAKPVWSKDSKQILIRLEKYTEQEDDPLEFDIALYNLKTQKFTRLTITENKTEDESNFSPDGKNIIYSDKKDGNIYIIYLK